MGHRAESKNDYSAPHARCLISTDYLQIPWERLSSRDSSFRNTLQTDVRNPEKTIVHWIPDLDFVSSGMTFGAVSGLFQQPARH
jgi:hypothetical protein